MPRIEPVPHQASAADDILIGRVLRIAAGTYDVDTPEGIRQASLRGRVKRRDDRIVSVGDRVELERSDDDDLRIARVLPRRSSLTRHGVARRREQVIVANVDQVVAVVAADAPPPDLNMVDRLLAIAELSEVEPFIVLNKIDLANRSGPESGGIHAPRTGGAREAPRPQTPTPTDASKDDAPHSDLEDYAVIGVDILATSASTGEGLEALGERLADRITVLSGQSGVGKSSLLNALVPGLDLRVGEVSERVGRGRHTTVSAALYPYPDGGYVADTPGLQYLALWEVDPGEVQLGFVEIAARREGCRFSDCGHRSEPGCAVREALEAGELSERRYESYLSLLAEAEEGR